MPMHRCVEVRPSNVELSQSRSDEAIEAVSDTGLAIAPGYEFT